MKLGTRLGMGAGIALAAAGLFAGTGAADAAIKADNHTSSATVSGNTITISFTNTTSHELYCAGDAATGDIEAQTDLYYTWAGTNGGQPMPAEIEAARDLIVGAERTYLHNSIPVAAGETATATFPAPGSGGQTYTITSQCVTYSPYHLSRGTYTVTRSDGGQNGGGDSSGDDTWGSLEGIF